MPPRKPSKNDMETYNVEHHIAYKLKLHHAHHEAQIVLAADLEGTKKAQEDLKKHFKVYEGGVPADPEEAKRYLEFCRTLVQNPASTMVENVMKAAAALTLASRMSFDEMLLPKHVLAYIDHEYMVQWKKWKLSSEAQQQPSQVNQQAIGKASRVVDQATLVALLTDPVTIEEKTFSVPGSGPEDTKVLKVIGSGRFNRTYFWDVQFRGAESSVRMDKADLIKLLLGGIVQDDIGR